jgi:hypothetical protein
MTLKSCHNKFIKRYLMFGLVPGTVDVPSKSVYVAAGNLVFGLNLLPRSRFGLRLQVNSQKLGL